MVNVVLVAIKNVTDEDDLMIINKSGIAIRMEIADLRVMGRATQGVKLINLKGNDSIAAVAKVKHDEDQIDEDDIESTTDATQATDGQTDSTPNINTSEEEE